ncbi:MAG: hypothetical protein QNJ44_12055 [Rhodobacter sp.]|nr:hypothetical protein [Rhodobacter sp.]
MSIQGKFDARTVVLAERIDRLRGVSDRNTGSAGVEFLRVALLGRWVGDAGSVADRLDVAVRWLDETSAGQLPPGEEALSRAARHSHARALAHLLDGDDRTELWAEAAQTHRSAFRGLDHAGRARLARGAMVCNVMAEGELPQHLTLADEFSVSVLDILSAAEPAEVGQCLYGARDVLFATEPGLTVTTLFAFVFVRRAALGSVAAAFRAGFVIDPDLALPPAMEAKGWADRDEAIVVLAPGMFDRLAGLLPFLGLSRDADAIAQGAVPGFASWTRQPDLSLEADWRASPGHEAYLEIRGTGAGRLAAFLAEELGGRLRPGPEEALTELLTVPPREVPAHGPAAEARWAALAVAVAGEGVFDDLPARALVSAGLADSDWRVRVVALWAVGHHRMPGLAAKAEVAVLPKPGYPGLSQDDRRVLLALRVLAAARSASQSNAIKPGADPDFVARIEALLDDPPQLPGTRDEALILAILRRPFQQGAALPDPRWAEWASAPTS